MVLFKKDFIFSFFFTFFIFFVIIKRKGNLFVLIRSFEATLIQQILENKNVRYRTEIPIPFGRFDFGIYSNNSGKDNLICLIEFDGIQHDNPNSWIGSESVSNNDLKKDEWAKKNKIPLIRLSSSEVKSVTKLSSFIEDELIPRLPESAFYKNKDKKEINIWSGIRNRSVNLSDLKNKTYTIKDLANLLNYSESYLSERIRNSGWFENNSGKSNFDKIPFCIAREDVILGLTMLGFLKDLDGNPILEVDSSMVDEFCNQIDSLSEKRIEELLIIIWDNSDFPSEINTENFKKIRILNKPDFRSAVLLASNDNISSILFIGSPNTEELSKLVDHSILKEKLIKNDRFEK